MTHPQMINTLVDCIEKFEEVQKRYERQLGGGAAQKVKNALAKERKLRFIEMTNAAFNIKQLVK